MTRDEFLRRFLPRIAALPPEEQQRLCEYYNEILLDRMESGWEEEAAVAELGSVDELAERALEEYVQAAPVLLGAADTPSRRRGAGWVVLKGFGWFSAPSSACRFFWRPWRCMPAAGRCWRAWRPRRLPSSWPASPRAGVWRHSLCRIPWPLFFSSAAACFPVGWAFCWVWGRDICSGCTRALPAF